MSDALARVIAVALEAARAVDEERIREICREEVARLQPARTTGWATPPVAAKACNCSVRRVRLLVKQGRVETRLRNLNANPTSPKYEVLVASVEAALRREPPKAEKQSSDTVSFAASVLAAKRSA